MGKEQNDLSEVPETSRAPARRRKRWIRIPAVLVAIWGVWCTALFLFQGSLIFPGALRAAPESHPPETAEVWWLDLSGGDRVEGWFLPAPDCGAEHPCPAVIYFHGNAELIDEEWHFVRGYHDLGWSVLMPEYRGFGRSGGRPSQQGIRADGTRFFDRLIERPDVDSDRVIFHGRSLGGAVAADLAAHRRPAALVLQSTFTSMGAMAQRFFVPGFLARQPFRTGRVVEDLDVPVLVLHGSGDTVVPVSHGRRLAELAKHGRYIEYVCGHNDLPPSAELGEYWSAIGSILAPESEKP